MIHHVFAVYDDKAGAFLPPFFLHTVGLARRLFTDSANQEGHPFNQHPADFTLFRIGRWDDNTGKYEERETFENLGIALLYKASENEVDALQAIAAAKITEEGEEK